MSTPLPRAQAPAVLLIDDHALFRTGLRILLTEHWPQARLQEATAVEAVPALPAPDAGPDDARPDLVLLDLNLPGLSGLAALPLLRERVGDAPVVIVSAQDNAVVVRAAREAGVRGFLSKAAPPGELMAALGQVLAGQDVWPAEGAPCVPPSAADEPPLPGGAWAPTPEQRRILTLLGSHHSNKALARALSLSENQARAEVSVLMERLGVISRRAAFQAASRLGWLTAVPSEVVAHGGPRAP